VKVHHEPRESLSVSLDSASSRFNSDSFSYAKFRALRVGLKAPTALTGVVADVLLMKFLHPSGRDENVWLGCLETFHVLLVHSDKVVRNKKRSFV